MFIIKALMRPSETKLNNRNFITYGHGNLLFIIEVQTTMTMTTPIKE